MNERWKVWGIVLLLLVSCNRQNDRPGTGSDSLISVSQETEGEALIEFDSLAYDFGTIIEGEQVLCFFDYSNTGSGALVLQSVEASCGCTKLEWDPAPLKPGESASLVVYFDSSGRSGRQRKTVTVRSNAKVPVTHLLINANVIAR